MKLKEQKNQFDFQINEKGLSVDEIARQREL